MVVGESACPGRRGPQGRLGWRGRARSATSGAAPTEVVLEERKSCAAPRPRLATFLLWRGRVDLRADDVAARRGQRFNLVRAAVSQKVAMEITGHLTPSVFERYNITDDRPEGGREEARGCRAVWTQRCTQQGAPPEDLPLLWACYVNRPGRNRTCNPRFWRPVLYQLSYGPRTCCGWKLANPRERRQAPIVPQLCRSRTAWPRRHRNRRRR